MLVFCRLLAEIEYLEGELALPDVIRQHDFDKHQQIKLRLAELKSKLPSAQRPTAIDCTGVERELLSQSDSGQRVQGVGDLDPAA